MTTRQSTCTPKLIEEELERILASGDFDASERNRRFLEYIVQEKLAGRADRIKAYNIATTVFGRDESFDPQMDPIVRIEASRLRRSIERYYLTAGSDDPVLITIPKGAYVPEFALQTAEAVANSEPTDPREEPAPDMPPPSRTAFGYTRAVGLGFAAVLAAGLLAAWFTGFDPFAKAQDDAAIERKGPSIFVMPFDEDGDAAIFPNFTRGLTRELVVALANFESLFVFGPETSFSYSESTDRRQIANDLDVDFILTGGTTVFGNRFAVDSQLIDARTGQYVWATRAEGEISVEDILAVRDKLANEVAQSLAQPYGVIFTSHAKNSEAERPETLSSYDCVLRFYLYWKSYKREFYPSVYSCLQEAIARDPEYAEAYAALSLIYSDAYRFGFAGDAIEGDPRVRALKLAKRSVEISPDLARGYHALMLAYWFYNDMELSFEAARKGLALNPHDTELMAELGMRYAFRGDMEKGLPLLREAYARNPGQPSSYRMALFIHHYLDGRYEEAYAEARKIDIDATNLVYSHICIAMAAAQLGKMQEAEDAVDRILALVPNYAEIAISDLEKRSIAPIIIEAVVDGLRKAGMGIASNAKPAES